MPTSGRKTIGFLINTTTGETNYENDLWLGAHDAAAEHGFDLIVFAGEQISPDPATGKARTGNFIYDLYSPGIVDAMVLATTTVCSGIGDAEIERFIKRYGDIPFVMIQGLKGRYRSLVDNSGGVYEAVNHLITVHGKKRIGFIRGPLGTESDERFEAYRRALKDKGLEYDERLTYVGNFLAESGTACAAELVDVRKVPFDAMAAANDGMAFGFIQGLHARGKRVPFDVSVVGFDDIEGATFLNPPLTTVRQPVYKQSYQAVRMACDLLEGKPVQKEMILSTENVYRQSCGCLLQSIMDHRTAVGSSDPPSAGDWRERRQEIAAGIIGGAGMTRAEMPAAQDLVARIAAHLRGEAVSQSADELLAYVESTLAAFADSEASAGRWLSFMRETRAAMMVMAENPERAQAAEVLSLRLERIADEMRLRAAGMRNLSTDRLNAGLRGLTMNMGATFDRGQLLALLDASLPRNGIPGYSLALFEGGEAEKGIPARLHQAGAFVDGKHVAPPSSGEAFPSARYFKRDLFSSRRRSFILEPLSFGRTLIGVTALEVDLRKGAPYNSTARQLESSLMGARFLEESEKSGKALAERAERIERLVLPMIESLEKVAALATEKSLRTEALADAAKVSQERLNGTITTLSAVASGISAMAKLLEAIDEISVTVNLVSLNASIEAAHAGQFGRGFAIIAKEIKKHAESTQSKTAEIMESIKGILGKVDLTTKAGQESLASYRDEEEGVKILLDTFTVITRDMGALAEAGRKILDTMKA